MGGLEALYVSKRLTLADSTVSGFTVVNVTLLGRRLTRHLDLSASVYNLFNKTYYDPGAEQHRSDTLQQDGRSLRLQITLHSGERK